MKIDVRKYLPEQYKDFVQDDGEINWEALEMVYPGHKEKIMSSIDLSLKLIATTLDRMLNPERHAGVQGPQGISVSQHRHYSISLSGELVTHTTGGY